MIVNRPSPNVAFPTENEFVFIYNSLTGRGRPCPHMTAKREIVACRRVLADEDVRDPSIKTAP